MLSMSMSSGSRRGGSLIHLLILRILYLSPMHGYKLIGKVNELLTGRRSMKTGSLYTILRRMEKAGLLESEWDEDSPRLDRRIYKPSKEGIEALKDGRRRVEEQKRALDDMIAFYNEHFKEEPHS
ncbi:putative transcriptional regulator [Thaumarchaeota archaeon SCGC AB-539-E09]|nr:putative transcriptional regulator [Thaumarchaeota archaeon SCGC AB-539-E09]